MHRLTAIVASLILVLAVPVVAYAHIEIAPDAATPGAHTTFTLTVPNERSTAKTTSIAIRLPDGVSDPAGVSAHGWTATLTHDAGHPVLRWSGSTISGEQSATFTFSATMPNDDGAELSFPATQTYSSGEIDRWIESADGDLPAPVVTLTSKRAGATPPAASGSSRAGWLIGGTIALLVAIGALALGRRGRHADPTSTKPHPDTDRTDVHS